MESAQLAAEFGDESHDGSPLSQGILQPDMWGDYARRLRVRHAGGLGRPAQDG
jgi:hypothetical protein